MLSKTGAGHWKLLPMSDQSERTNKRVGDSDVRRKGPPRAYPTPKTDAVQSAKVPLRGVQVISQQVVRQLVDTWSVNYLESQQSQDRPLVQSADLVIERPLFLFC